MNIAPISEPNTMIPATAATQKMRRPAMSRSYSGLRGAALADEERDPGGDARSTASPSASAPSSGTAAKLMARTSAGHEHDRQDAAEVVDRLGRLVDVGRARTAAP